MSSLGTGPKRSRRTAGKVLALTATVAALAGGLLGGAPAQAADTSKAISADGTSVTFQSGTFRELRRDKLVGNVRLDVRSDGNWTMTGYAKNNLIAWRNVKFVCDLTFGPNPAHLQFSVDLDRVHGGATKTSSATAYDPNLQWLWGDVLANGDADCDIKIG